MSMNREGSATTPPGSWAGSETPPLPHPRPEGSKAAVTSSSQAEGSASSRHARPPTRLGGLCGRNTPRASFRSFEPQSVRATTHHSSRQYFRGSGERIFAPRHCNYDHNPALCERLARLARFADIHTRAPPFSCRRASASATNSAAELVKLTGMHSVCVCATSGRAWNCAAGRPSSPARESRASTEACTGSRKAPLVPTPDTAAFVATASFASRQ
jgi:hypothetical protein